MKVKPGFILREVADTYVVLPVGDAVMKFNGMLSLNETGVVLWRQLEQGAEMTDLVKALVERYGIEEEKAQRDVAAFLEALSPVDCLED